MAKDDAEFDSIREEPMTGLDAMNFEQARDEVVGLYEQAKKDAKEFFGEE